MYKNEIKYKQNITSDYSKYTKSIQQSEVFLNFNQEEINKSISLEYFTPETNNLHDLLYVRNFLYCLLLLLTFFASSNILTW